jgi:hypothetical protein
MNYNPKWLWNCHNDDHQNPILRRPIPMKHCHWNIFKSISPPNTNIFGLNVPYIKLAIKHNPRSYGVVLISYVLPITTNLSIE